MPHAASEPGTYDLYAIRYATMAGRTRADNFIDPPHGAGQSGDTVMPIDYFVWVAIGPSGTFVIDTGFAADDAAARGRTLLRTAAEGLDTVGVDAATVRDVILTHMHYDHAGGCDMFPEATFHLQAAEMRFATGPHMCAASQRDAFTAGHVAGMVRRVFEGRVTFHDGDRDIATGLSVHFIGGHTMGLQVVRVRTRRGWVVLASDASHFYENMEAAAPFPIVFDVDEMIRGYARLNELADSPDHIIPGHDPLVLARYAPVSSRLKDIAVRLDVVPPT